MRNGCLSRSVAEGRRSGLLFSQRQVKAQARIDESTDTANHFALMSWANSDKTMPEGTGGAFCLYSCHDQQRSAKAEKCCMLERLMRVIADAHLHHDWEHLLSMPRTKARPHLDYDTSDAPYVYFVVVSGLGADDLGSHPKYGALHAGGSAVIGSLLRDAEV